ncbi:MAG: PorP/SprF family type IX secretion system membrane protein [Filimonas sp.]|nr:PorP/SprF family type IX secretion system membrane protein [Filimonas sp.]
MKKLIILIALWVAFQFVICAVGKAQVDPHFSQYYAYPLWLNPAMTGAIDGDYRVSANYRNQWGNISNPFSTIGISADMVTNKSLNFGVNLLNQSAGDGGYNYFNGSASVAYTGLRFGPQGYKHIVFGLQAGAISTRFDPTKLKYGDQWNPITGYDPSNPTSEALARTSATVFDAGAGVMYFDGEPDKVANLFVGFSASHLTRPENKFIVGSDAKMPIRWAANAGVRLDVSDVLKITPNALYMRQGNAEEKMVGAYGQIMVSNTTDVLLGGYYRFSDAVVPFAGLHLGNLVLGFSYDANTSKLGSLSRASNAFEISLSLIGRKARMLPDQFFICPRL